MRTTLAEIRSTTARLIRTELETAAGADGILQDAERDGLTPFVAAAAAGLTDPDDAIDAAMTKATSTWASFNQRSGTGAGWLSQKERARVARQDPALGVLTESAARIAATVKQSRPPLSVVLDAPPGIGMGVSGVRVLEVSLSAGPSVAAGTSFDVVVDGHRLTVTRTAAGLDVWGLKAPEGYGLTVIERGPMSDPTASARLKITRDAETALPHAYLAVKAKAQLVSFIKNERMHAADWGSYFPTTWNENVARGVLDRLDAFFTDPATEVIRSKDTVLFVGRGPYDLLTEIELSKKTGAVVHVLVEID